MSKKTKYTKKLLEPLVKTSFSMAQVLEKLGLKPTGGNYKNIRRHIANAEISTLHFTGQGWNKGKTATTNKVIAKITRKITIYSDEEVFCVNSPVKNRDVKKRLIKAGRPYACAAEGCPLYMIENPLWKGEKLTLHLDHINGCQRDNRKINLQFLCPNCHQQTNTWGNKNNPK